MLEPVAGVGLPRGSRACGAQQPAGSRFAAIFEVRGEAPGSPGSEDGEMRLGIALGIDGDLGRKATQPGCEFAEPRGSPPAGSAIEDQALVEPGKLIEQASELAFDRPGEARLGERLAECVEQGQGADGVAQVREPHDEDPGRLTSAGRCLLYTSPSPRDS